MDNDSSYSHSVRCKVADSARADSSDENFIRIVGECDERCVVFMLVLCARQAKLPNFCLGDPRAHMKMNLIWF